MKAVRFHGKHDLRIDDVDAPRNPGFGEVLVAPTFCGICGSDLHEYDHGPTWTSSEPNPYSSASLPQILGHEFAARVVSVGDGVSTLVAGDRVSIQPQTGPRDDYFGRRNVPFLGPQASVIGLSWPWGGMAELAIVNESNAVRLPEFITDQQGALVEPAAVGVHAVDRSGVQPGGSLLVTGGGTIGAMAALAGRAAGVARIFVSEPNANRRRRIEGLGIGAVVLDPAECDVGAFIRQATEDGVGVDAAIECSGNGRALNACVDAVKPQGTIVQVGLMGGKVEVEPFRWTVKDITIKGSLNYPITIWPRIFEMMRSGLFPVEKVVDAEISMADVKHDGFDALLDKASAKLKILVAMPR
ncbi:alcohol dehydrogenase catalytic domain-containing protein [Burkholderia pyrrocinia]|uniref:zinc-binding dehydrogenase n=1 Tax=Burkholderia pyrrocinia TaxID=60550 RepID=UPI0015764418|nr:zinc-binding dehydrogenase [Burkholderia pyrrocinia]NTX26960.1 alcohol dehydrogenase catalytic domain-containing protein [Burkholderia pyrrocinia]QVN20349.1 alcohol dehydrogenase catalytic domain-containing protein [Burkholderia pyrrocinia]